MKKLKFNNEWMTLHVKSMGKLHHVLGLVSENDRIPKGCVEVAMVGDRQVIALQYPCAVVMSSSIGAKKDTTFIKCDNKYFAVRLITKCMDSIHEKMKSDDTIGLIATDQEGYHYIASNTES